MLLISKGFQSYQVFQYEPSWDARESLRVLKVKMTNSLYYIESPLGPLPVAIALRCQTILAQNTSILLVAACAFCFRPRCSYKDTILGLTMPVLHLCSRRISGTCWKNANILFCYIKQGPRASTSLRITAQTLRDTSPLSEEFLSFLMATDHLWGTACCSTDPLLIFRSCSIYHI